MNVERKNMCKCKSLTLSKRTNTRVCSRGRAYLQFIVVITIVMHVESTKGLLELGKRAGREYCDTPMQGGYKDIGMVFEKE